MTVRLEIVVITLLIGMIMGGHLLCSCAKVPISEAFSEMMEGAENQPAHDTAGSVPSLGIDTASNQDPSSDIDVGAGGPVPIPVPAPPNGDADAKKKKEGFGDFSEYKKGENNTDVTGSWMSKANKYSSDLGYQATNCKSNAYVGTAVPLPDGELFFFQNNQFKPECCPGPYSSSTGCACMSTEQIRYLNTRGGNRTSDSEF